MPRYTTRLSLANAFVKLETAELALPSTAAETTPKRLQCKRESTTSPYFRKAVPVQLDDAGVPLPLGMRCHLIQETLCHDLYALVVQAILWNQTKGIMARPVLLAILDRYPNVETLVRADLVELTAIIQPIGLHNRRAARLIAMAETWLAHPPSKDKRYKKLHYPSKHDGRDIANGFVLDAADPREAYEIAHLPGVGAYALDSYRIFHRDRLRGLSTGWRGEGMPEGCEPEWRRVVPQDKELRAFLKWLWFSEGWDWDAETGARRPV